MEEKNFVALVADYLKEEILEFQEYGQNEITLNLRDVNFKILGEDWEKRLSRHLKNQGFNVRFSYGDENWVTLHLI